MHGSNFSTEIVGFFEDENSCVDAAKKFCEDNNIVEDSAWANLKEENGVDGGYIGSEARKIMSEKAIERVLKGTHHFIGPEMNRRSIANGTNVFAKGDEVRHRVKNGTHLFLNKEWHKESSRKSIESGKHNFLGGRIQREQVLKGTHPFLNGEMQRRNIIKRFQEGKHPTQIKKVCPYCNKEENSTLFAKYHGDKCPMKNSTQISFL